MRVEIDCDVVGFAQQLQGAASQVRFTAVLALTRTAEEIVQTAKAQLRQKFTIRRPWVEKGFRVDRAQRRDPEPAAVIRHKDEFMARQEFGGVKLPRSPGKLVAAPVAGGARRQPADITTPSRWPGRLKRAFYVDVGKAVVQFQRTGRRGRKRRRQSAIASRADRNPFRDPALRKMYVLKRSIFVPARWGLRELARQIFRDRWGINFTGLLQHALRTARPPR